MINTRLAFHKILVELLGNSNVYFQAPENKVLKYPCIIYKLSDVPEKHADNNKYIRHYEYTVTLIHKDPDNCVVDRILNIPNSKFEQSYATQGLNHYVFKINYKNEKEII